MPYLQKPAFEQFRREAIDGGKPMFEKNVVPIQAAVIAALDEFVDLLIEKTRRLPHNEGMIEISAKWFGMDADQSGLVRILRKGWKESALSSENAAFWVGPSDEAVLLMFAATYEGGRFITGRMLINF